MFMFHTDLLNMRGKNRFWVSYRITASPLESARVVSRGVALVINVAHVSFFQHQQLHG